MNRRSFLKRAALAVPAVAALPLIGRDDATIYPMDLSEHAIVPAEWAFDRGIPCKVWCPDRMLVTVDYGDMLRGG